MIAKYEALPNIQSVIEVNAPTFAALSRNNKDKTINLLKLMIIAFDRFVNVRNSLSEDHIDFIVSTILSRYKWMTTADLCYVLGEAKMGKYGNLYERLSPMQIFSWIDNYFEQRCSIAENNSIRNSEQFK